MGRRSTTGGVKPKGDDGIEFDFWYQRRRYRITVKQTPTETNLRNSRKRLEAIKRRIRAGTFNFAEEFPDYRFIGEVAPLSDSPSFKTVAINYLRSIRSDAEYATFESYRKILGVHPNEIAGKSLPDAEKQQSRGFWIPLIGAKPISDIRYSELTTALGDAPCSRKTRNNRASVCRLVFGFAIADQIITRSPAENIKSLKVQKEPPDPYSVKEAEAVIVGIREDWGDWDANYVEFCFFAGTRPSELIALQWPDVDRNKGLARIDKARVMARDKDTTKTSVIRDIELNPRALSTIEHQWVLTGLNGKHVFGHGNGLPYHDLQTQWKRWKFTHKRLGVRYREPYQMRHTSVSWNLMIGKNLLWVAEQHGHSPAVMLKTYAKWLKGATENDIAAIRAAMGFASNSTLTKSQ